MAYNTGNPVPSSDPRDLFDNALNIDRVVNDTTNEEWLDRLGITRKTLQYFLNRGQDGLNQLAAIIAGAQEQINDSTFRRPFGSLADAQADAIANPDHRTDVYLVMNDTSANNGSYFWNGTTLAKTALQPPSQDSVDTAIQLSQDAIDAISAEVLNRMGLIVGSENENYFMAGNDGRGYRFMEFPINGGVRSGLVSINGKIIVDEEGNVKTKQINTDSGQLPLNIKDRNGFSQAYIDDEFTLRVNRLVAGPFDSQNPIPGVTDFSTGEIEAYDGAAMSYSALMNNQPFNGFQPVGENEIDAILVDGQSWENGKSCAPSLTRIAVSGVYMIGDSVRGVPGSPSAPAWSPIGVAQLNPAVAVTQNNSPPGQVLSRAAEAALTYPTGYNGEEPGVAAAQMFRKAWLAYRGLSSDSNREVVVINVSVGGATIDELSNDSLYYQRVNQGLQAAKDLAGSRSIALVATLFGQGQADYNNGTTEQQYYDKAVAFRAKIDASALSIFGQAKQAIFVTRQVGNAVWTQNHLNIGNAQRRLALEQPNWILSTPDYLVPDDSVPGEGSHPTNNGIRWLACYMGWSLIQALLYGRKTRPLQPYKAVVRGRQILLTFDAPVPGLQSKPFYGPSGQTFTVPNLGLYASDASGELGIESVQQVGKVSFLIQANRAAGSDVIVWGGRRSLALGGLNICDSSKLSAPFNYEYHADYGQPAAENIVELVDKPYPMNNFSVAFKIPATTV